MWRYTNPFSHFLHRLLGQRATAARAGTRPLGASSWDIPIVLSGAGLGEAAFAPVLLEGAFCAEIYRRNAPTAVSPRALRDRDD